MKHIISFSVYGDNPKYTIGILRNIELADIIYPGWWVYIYHDSSVPKENIELYNQFDYVKTVDMTGSEYPGMFWRFLVEDDVFISRDADSRLSLREKYAVDEWLYSGKRFHVLRDHPAHSSIAVPGGMWGIKRINPGQNVNMQMTIQTWLKNNTGTDAYGQDQIFLQGLYMYHKQQNDIMVHDSLGTFDDISIPFPTKLAPSYHFIGEVFDENDLPRPDHHNDWLNNRDNERIKK